MTLIRNTVWVLCFLAAGAQAQMTVRQSLEIRSPEGMSFSPDGTQLAYVVKRAVLETNTYEQVLYVAPTQGGAARTVISSHSMTAPQWSADGRHLIYLAPAGEVYQAWMVGLDGSPPKQLTHQPSGVGTGLKVDYLEKEKVFQLSPDGKRGLYYTRNKIAADKQVAAAAKGNLLYTEEHTYDSVVYPQDAWMNTPAAVSTLWLVDVESAQERIVWRTPAPGKDTGGMPMEFAWSPDGQTVALVWSDSRLPQLTRTPLVLLSTDDFSARDAIPKLGHTIRLEWTPDGQALQFFSTGEVDENTKVLYDYRNYRYSPSDGNLVKLPGERTRVQPVAAEIKTSMGDLVADCVYDRRRIQAACRREDTMTPPEVALYELKKKGTWRRARIVTHLNPELDGVKIGKVQPIRGLPQDEMDSGLILPVDYQPGKKYPLVVMLYNQYYPTTFTGSLSFTSYPAQVFAANGYMVILQNPGQKVHIYEEGNFPRARATEADAVTNSLRAMMDQLIAKDRLDTKRVGIMGWSWGGFFGPYIATHHPEWVQAAAMGDTNNHQSTAYWRFNASWRRQEDRYFGQGGPSGPNAANWRAVSPMSNADKLQAPMLMEYSVSLLSGLEMYRTLLDAGKIAELHAYPTELHVFERPQNRFDSMQRHFDWFHFWLSGVENPDPRYSDQNKRWRELREKQAAQ